MRSRRSRPLRRSPSRWPCSRMANRRWRGGRRNCCGHRRSYLQSGCGVLEGAMRRASLVLLALLLLVESKPALAQTYPERPITVIVPYGAGGPLDTLMRIIGERMREALGQTIVI